MFAREQCSKVGLSLSVIGLKTDRLTKRLLSSTCVGSLEGCEADKIEGVWLFRVGCSRFVERGERLRRHVSSQVNIAKVRDQHVIVRVHVDAVLQRLERLVVLVHRD